MIYEIRTNSTDRMTLTPVTGEGDRLGPSCTKIQSFSDVQVAIEEIHDDHEGIFKNGDEFAFIKGSEAKIVFQFPKTNTLINLLTTDLRLRARESQPIKKVPKRNPKKKSSAAGRKLKSFKARVKYMLYLDTPGNQTLEIDADGSNDWSIGFKNSRDDYFQVVHNGSGGYGIALPGESSINCTRDTVLDTLNGIAIPE